jgi:hypothetical protein
VLGRREFNPAYRDYDAGDNCGVFVNQAMRDATVLAVLSRTVEEHLIWEYLLEYEMPNGTTALWFDSVLRKHHNLAYKDVPDRWLSEIIAREQTWIGVAQGGRKALSPQAMLEQRAQAKGGT